MPEDAPKKPTRRGKLPIAVRKAILRDLKKGTLTQAEICAKHNVGRNSVSKLNVELARGREEGATADHTSGLAHEIAREAGAFPAPIALDMLDAEPARALEDIEYFARRYYGVQLLPWQVHSAKKITDLLATPYEEYAVINVAPGSGKAQPVGEPVLTPDGWRPIGELAVGDEVIGSDGRPTLVTGVFPQGVRKVAMVRFSDGALVRADHDHIWQVSEKKGGWKTRTTAEIFDAGVRRSDDGLRWFVPLVEPVEYEKREMPLIPAYSMGALLGDGCFRNTSVGFSSVDDEILDHVGTELGQAMGLVLNHEAGADYRIVFPYRTGKGGSPFIDELKRLGVWGTNSLSKFVPDEYMRGSIEDRWDLLAGLMDTDGTVTKSGRSEFCSISPDLADAVVELVRSLGGLATVRTKTPTYVYNGERKEGQLAYSVLIDLPECPFRLQRKVDLWKPKQFSRRYISDISAAGTDECVCISVAASDSLYVTSDFVVTHNTAFFGRILPAWLTVRDRAMRGMIGSATNLVATKIIDLLRRDFVKPTPDLLTERDAKQGLVLAESTLSREFGRLRPDVEGHLWTRGSFEVAQYGDSATTQKEPTWTAMGKDTTFIGWRVDFALWDDVWDPRSVRSADAKIDFFDWFDNVAESRLEPGGLFLLQGQRLAPDDIYRHALDKVDDLDDDDLADFEQIDGEEPRRKKYHHIVYKAYDETKDTGDPALLRPDAPPWPEGPLLSPFRIKWRKLRQIKANTPDTFSLVYQQEDHELSETLVNPLWIKGGQAADGTYHIGCRDDDRKMWELPEGLKEPLVSVAMTDPSHTKYWATHWYLWQAPMSDGDVDLRHLMAMDFSRMQAPEFLDFNTHTGTWHGLMEDWWQISNDLGRPIKYWIVEQNGAQRYLLQFNHVHEWMRRRGVTIIGHNTGRNKKDPDFGVQILGPVYQRGQMRIPMADTLANGPGKDMQMLKLIKQVTEYPYGTYDDIVMSQWFFESNKDLIRPHSGQSTPMRRPSFLKAFERKEVAA